jgi:hypothetical protein
VVGFDELGDIKARISIVLRKSLVDVTSLTMAHRKNKFILASGLQGPLSDYPLTPDKDSASLVRF